MKIHNRLMAFGLAGALALGAAVSASAGPLPTGIATVKSATTDHVTDIRWRGRGFGPAIGIGAGIAAGALIGSAVAGRPYYGSGYYYDAPVYAEPYAEPYAYEPVYPAPGYYGGYGYYRGGGCYTDEGYGRRRACSGY